MLKYNQKLTYKHDVNLDVGIDVSILTPTQLVQLVKSLIVE